MNRSIANKIRYVLEDILPAFVRDSIFFKALLYIFYKKDLEEFTSFRQRIPYMSEKEYDDFYYKFYSERKTAFDVTDLNEACIKEILKLAAGPEVIDVGCGKAYMSGLLAQNKELKVTGFDLHVAASIKEKYAAVTFVEGAILKMPFQDASFDTVLCPHTMEHIVDFQGALNELRRICKKRLIIVVPKEREFLYSFNPHVNFFPYKHSLLIRINPGSRPFTCREIDGDLFYVEEK